MAINLVTFAAQTVTPQDDALIYETALSGSGMIYGGTVTIKSANVLRVAEGHGAICGRKFTIEAMDVPIALTPSGSLLGRIYIHMDLSDTDEPISIRVETASSLTPVIQDSDVNINNGVYEINLATFTVDTATISNLVNVTPFIPSATGKVLYLTGLACAATSGDFTNYSNSEITARHVVTECVFANPSSITTDVTWTTTNGNLTLNGTCASATTVNLVLVKKDN